jgi:hypothetical protein
VQGKTGSRHEQKTGTGKHTGENGEHHSRNKRCAAIKAAAGVMPKYSAFSGAAGLQMLGKVWKEPRKIVGGR